MKYAFALALSLGVSFGSLSWAVDVAATADSAEVDSEDPAQALQDLCKSYIKDGTITANEYNSCLSNMTDLSESTSAPLSVTEEVDSAPSEAANTPADAEALVSDEIVEKPDPQAEQLSIN
ncbi:hypothetical protein [Thiofilum flexile]|uniref:hypothetical protein n=1 Tax=Thiofilum flexile TaxID=125627 RepID=UPI00036A43C9|nr:hypothetical protein [Thiofilum flexile]